MITHTQKIRASNQTNVRIPLHVVSQLSNMGTQSSGRIAFLNFAYFRQVFFLQNYKIKQVTNQIVRFRLATDHRAAFPFSFNFSFRFIRLCCCKTKNHLNLKINKHYW
uniref:(northern house mosquito) hypothetical protein n=1 Tax=Culex pipiens TaxID=7175 RepID=A0A8D8DFS9_CULPI